MMCSSVIEKRVTTEDLIKHGACPVKEFKVYIVGLDLTLLDKFNLVLDITEKNFRECAKEQSKAIMGPREDYIIKVQGEYITVLIDKEKLGSSYKASLCRVMDYDSEEYIKELNNEVVKICLKSNSNSEDLNRVLLKKEMDERTRLMTSPDGAFRNFIDYSGFGVI